MRVQCPKCLTQLDVDENRIPQKGAKIKCAECDTIFKVSKPAPKTANKPEKSASEDLFSTPVEDEFNVSNAPSFLGDESDNEDLFGSSSDLDDVSGRTDDLTPTMEFNPNPENEHGSTDSPKVDPYAGKNYPDFDWPDADEVEKITEKKPPKLELSDNLLDDEAFMPALDANVGNQLLSKYIPNKSIQHNLEKNKKMRRAVSFALLMILIFGAGGYAAINIDKIMSFPFATFVSELKVIAGIETAKKISPNLSVQSKFTSKQVLKTLTGEKILVIDGLTVNRTDKSVSFVEVKVVLKDEAGKTVTEASVYAGNKLSNVQLRTFGFDRIREMHDRDYGANLSNFNIGVGARLPFQAVFAPVVSFATIETYAAPTNGKKFTDEQR